MTNKFFRNQLFRMFVPVILIAILHFFLLKNVLPDIYTQSQPWKIYLLLIPLEILGLAFIFLKYQKDNTTALRSFLLFMVVKMLVSIAFLAPWALSGDKLARPIVYQFFIIFFIILFSELVFLIKMLAQKSD